MRFAWTTGSWRLSIFLLLLALGCADDTPVDPPPELGPLAQDERLGTLVLEGSQMRETSFIAYYVGDQIFVVVYQGSGYDDVLDMAAEEELRFFEVDDVTYTVIEHAAPPVTPAARFLGSIDIDGNALAFATAPPEGDGEMAFWDGSAWSVLPPPPVPTAELGGLLSRSSGRILTRSGSRAFLYDGTEWIEVDVPADAIDVRLGPWDSEGFRLVYVADDRLGTQRYSGSTAETRGDPEELRGDFRGLISSAINGDTSSFQISTGDTATGGFSVLLEEGALEVVDRIDPGLFFAAPGSDTTLFARDGSPEHGLRFSSGAQVGEVALFPFRPHLTCGCDRTVDLSCPCVDREPTAISYLGAPTADRLAMTMVDDVEGSRSIYVRVVDLPIIESPFLDRDGPCQLPCGIDGEPLECVLSTQGRPECVPIGSVPDGGLLDAGPLPFDAGPEAGVLYGATMTGTFARSNEGPAPAIVEVVPASEDAVFEVTYEGGFSIACTPETDYRITIRSADEHRPVVIDVTSPTFGNTLHLGDFTMVQGEPLGPAWGDEAIAPTAVVSPADGTMVVVGGDGWHVVEPDTGSVTGVAATHLAGSPGLLPTSRELLFEAPRLMLTNDDTLVLAETETGLTAIDLDAGSLTGEVSTNVDLGSVTFADSAPVAMFARTGTKSMPGSGPIVVGWGGGMFRELLSIDVTGEEDWLNPDGTRVMRIEGGAVVEYDISTGMRTVVNPTGTGRWMRMGNDDIVAVQRTGMPAIGTCWLEPAGCGATIIRADRGDTQLLTDFHGFALSTTSGNMFYTRREGGRAVAYRFSLASGSAAVAGTMFGGVAFEWLQQSDAVVFEDATGIRAVEISTGNILHTEPGRHAMEQRTNGSIVLTPNPCGVDCDLIVLDAPAGTTERIADAGAAVFLGPERSVQVGSPTGAVTVGARAVARLASMGDELAGPQPRPIDHLDAPCWPFSWLEKGVGNTPVARTLYCAR